MKDNGLMVLPPYKPLQTELWKVKFQCHPRWWWLKGLVPRPLVQACPSSWKNLPQKSHGTRAPDLWLRNSSLWNMEVGPWRYPILSNTFGNLENQIQIMNQNVTDFQMAKNKSIWSPISLSIFESRFGKKRWLRKLAFLPDPSPFDGILPCSCRTWLFHTYAQQWPHQHPPACKPAPNGKAQHFHAESSDSHILIPALLMIPTKPAQSPWATSYHPRNSTVPTIWYHPLGVLTNLTHPL